MYVAALAVMLSLAAGGCQKSRGGRDVTAAGDARTPPRSALSGTGASSSVFTSSAGRLPETKRLERFDAFSALGYRPEWIGYPVLPRGRTIHFVDAYPDIVVVQESGNSITVMDAATGANRWTSNMGSDLTRFVGNVRRGTGEIICSSESEAYILEAATGEIRERQRLGFIVNTKPVLMQNVLIYGCPGGEVLGHALGSGYKLWAYQLDGAITAPPVQVGSSVAAVSQGGEVIILNPRNGTAVGRGRMYAGLANAPVAGGTTLFLAGLDQSVWAFDETGREPRWRVRLEEPITAQPAHHDGRVYVVLPKEGLACFDASTGKRLWTTKGIAGTPVAVRNKRLIVWDGAVASLIDSESGDAVERLALPGVDWLIPDTFADGNLYAASRKGEVARYSPKK
jgi:outer membrane protein assembly factor BamB